MNKELQALFEEDQTDRRVFFEQLDHEQLQQVLQRDRARRQRVEELVGNEMLQAPEDYFHAAMVFQHGERLDDFWGAHELARRGAELGHPDCRWLTAAAYDRWLMNQGKVQKYGTQYTSRDNESYRLWEVDPTTTDEERAAWDVPPLAEALQKAEELTRRKEELREKGVLPPQGPQHLASLEVAGLRVEIIAFDERFVHPVPLQERPAREELPAPESFPRGWKLYRFGEGYCATRVDGQEVLTWHNIQQPELSYACREQEVPQLEAIQLGDRSAICIRSAEPSLTQLFLRVGEGYYVVGGQVALNELLQLATSIPAKK
ncbi:MAG: hypothetical protein ACJ797_02140 [Ktedonobacteraceae bacterium]